MFSDKSLRFAVLRQIHESSEDSEREREGKEWMSQSMTSTFGSSLIISLNYLSIEEERKKRARNYWRVGIKDIHFCLSIKS